MRIKAVATSILTASLAGAPAARLTALPVNDTGDVSSLTEAPLVLKRGTRQLTSADLATLLADAEVQKVVPPELTWLEPPEVFRSDGRYTLYVHREEIEGRYTVAGNAFCVELPDRPKKCRYIFVDVNKRYWISEARSTRDFIQVAIRKIARSGP